MPDALDVLFCRPVTPQDTFDRFETEVRALEQLEVDSAFVPIEQVVDGELDVALETLPEDRSTTGRSPGFTPRRSLAQQPPTTVAPAGTAHREEPLARDALRGLRMRWSPLALLLLLACGEPASTSPYGPRDLVALAPIEGATFGAPTVCCNDSVSFTRAADGTEAGMLQAPSTRSFYSYRPTESAHANAPLLVVFNGDAPVSSFMLGGGTGPMAVVLDGEALDAPTTNPASWTRFAHLLYLDPIDRGFGYQTGSGLPNTQAAEAAEMLDAVLTFLECRAPRPDLPVVLVGESRGGGRVQLMLWLAHHPERIADDDLLELDWSAERRRAFTDRVRAFAERMASGRGEAAGGILERQLVGSALIQPALPNHPEQAAPSGPTPLADRLRADPNRAGPDVDRALPRRTAGAMFDRDDSRALLGVDVADIAWLAAMETDEAVGARHGEREPHFLDEVLGPLSRDRSYYGHALGQYGGLDSNDITRDNLRESHTFVTDARFDRIILSPALFESLAIAGRIGGFVWDEDIGEVEVSFPDGGRVLVPMPSFDANHVVAYDQPGQLADALEAWLAPIVDAR